MLVYAIDIGTFEKISFGVERAREPLWKIDRTCR